jgi:hypothetical protein
MPTKTSVGPNEVVRLEVLRLAPPLLKAAYSSYDLCDVLSYYVVGEVEFVTRNSNRSCAWVLAF